MMLNQIEHMVKHFGDEGGIKLHPASIDAMAHMRQEVNRPWLLLGWAALTTIAMLTSIYMMLEFGA